MSIINEYTWRKRLQALAEEKKKEKESTHPLASLGEDKTPANVQAKSGGTSPTLKEEHEQEKTFTLPSDTGDEGVALREQLNELASERTEAGKSERAEANENSNALYEALRAFTEKQDSRYDWLLDLVTENDYRSSAGAQEILYEYLTSGKTASADMAASLAGENGGNGDSYAAAMAGRTQNQYGTAGDSAARDYYGEQLDRILRVLQAAGGDMNDLYSSMQDNVDTAQDTASKDLSIGADLLGTLADAIADERKIEESTFSELLAAGNRTQTMEVSPMQIEEEYRSLTAKTGGGYSSAGALMVLWDKYPSMRTYLLEKYEKLQNSYTFGD